MKKITIQEIATVLTEKNGLDKREANRFASEMFTVILQRLETDHLVKVKGLGTFKLISVEARESVSVRTGERVIIGSHAKVTFTPDSIIRELVNKPFSQFETVVLNDGVEFEDLKDDLTPEELATIQPELSEGEGEPQDVIIEQEQPVAEEKPATPIPTIETVAVIPSVEEEEPAAAEEEERPAANEEEWPIAKESEPAGVEEEEVKEEADEEEEEESSHPWGRWLLAVLGVLALMALSAYGGYRYGRMTAYQAVSLPTDTLAAAETTAVADSTIKADTIAVVPIDTLEAEKAVVKEPVAEEPAKAAEEPVKIATPAAEPLDKYAEKDERVRLGAYRIVGTAEEVKVLAGQTFYSICRAHLGPDMECYVEVYNDLPRNAQVKAGQVIKIPKLELKKKRK